MFFKAINAGHDNSEKPEYILEALKKFIQTENAVGYSYFHSTSCGALLAGDDLKNMFPKLYAKYPENI